MAYTLARLVCLAVLATHTEAASTSTSTMLSMLQEIIFHKKSNARFLEKRQDPATQAINTLDANHDGVIQPNEVAEFAASQGLDVNSVRREFAGLDADGDGVLSTKEVARALQGTQPATSATVTASTEPDDSSFSASAAQLESLQNQLMEDTSSLVDVAEHGQVTFDSSKTKKTEAAAAEIAKDLKVEEAEEAKAREMFRRSTEMRSQMVSMSELTKEKAVAVGAKVAHEQTAELLRTITNLSQEALKAEEKAAALRAKSKMELKEAQELMAVADQALRRQTQF